MWRYLMTFSLGMSTPLLLKHNRTLVRAVVKQGIILSRHLQKMAEEAREDLQDVMAEAAAELESETKKE